MGTLYWQINDNWPVASWASIDYFGRWKALHYMAKKFYAPQAVSMCRDEDTMQVYLENESMEAQPYQVVFYVKIWNARSLRRLPERALWVCRSPGRSWRWMFPDGKTGSIRFSLRQK